MIEWGSLVPDWQVPVAFAGGLFAGGFFVWMHYKDQEQFHRGRS